MVPDFFSIMFAIPFFVVVAMVLGVIAIILVSVFATHSNYTLRDFYEESKEFAQIYLMFN